MNLCKKANLLYLSIVIISCLGTLFFSVINTQNIEIPIVFNLLLGQAFIIFPGIVFLLLNQNEIKNILNYKKIKLPTVFLLFVLTELLMPLVIFVNVLSQLFVKNTLVSVSGQIVEMPFLLALFIMGIVGPFCEEFVFRGIIFNCLRNTSLRAVLSGIISAVFFGFLHMNINQCGYAFVLGFVFALVNELLDSNWPSFIMHAIVNSQNVALVYIAAAVMSGNGQTLNEAVDGTITTPIILIMALVYLFIALFTTALAVLLIYGICKIEGKESRIKALLKGPLDKENKMHILSVPGIIGLLICLIMMFIPI